jgi:glutathione S-transferase
MLQLIQFPWSPYCLAQKRILEYSGAAFKVVNIPPSDRSLVWRLTKQRYYQVPVLKDGASVIFETDEMSQVIAKYIDSKLGLRLFPQEWDGIQRTVWYYIENEIESVSFKLNDAYWKEIVPPSEQLAYLRFKERKFGRGCLEQWMKDQKPMLAALMKRLTPFEQMLGHRSFLLDSQPRFVDFELWGMLANFLYSGHFELSNAHLELKKWYARMSKIKFSEFAPK